MTATLLAALPAAALRQALLGALAVLGGTVSLGWLVSPEPLAAQDSHGASMTGQVVEGDDFLVYDGQGRTRSFAHILEALDQSDAVLVGEAHDDVVGHGVEAQILARAARRFGAMTGGEPERPVVLSLEMFERDVQYILDEYLQGLITEDLFLESARPWARYRTDYRPLVELARAHRLPVVAANAPRRYINRVTRLGPASLEELPEKARRYLPPLPYPAPSEAYEEQWDRLMARMLEEAPAMAGQAEGQDGEVPPTHGGEEELPEGHVPGDDAPPPTHDLEHALAAQALWDAAMGEAVAEALERHPGALVVHLAGSFHVARGTGIPERVPEYRPGTRVLTVVLRPVEDIHGWSDDDHQGLADFVVLTREMPRPPSHGM